VLASSTSVADKNLESKAVAAVLTWFDRLGNCARLQAQHTAHQQGESTQGGRMTPPTANELAQRPHLAPSVPLARTRSIVRSQSLGSKCARASARNGRLMRISSSVRSSSRIASRIRH
jgi:hypothetical protein